MEAELILPWRLRADGTGRIACALERCGCSVAWLLIRNALLHKQYVLSGAETRGSARFHLLGSTAVSFPRSGGCFRKRRQMRSNARPVWDSVT